MYHGIPHFFIKVYGKSKVASVASVASVACVSSPCLPWSKHHVQWAGWAMVISSYNIHIYPYIYCLYVIYIYTHIWLYIYIWLIYVYTINMYIYILFAWSPAMDIAPSYSLIGPRKPGGDRRINHLVQDVNPGSPGWKSGSGTIQWIGLRENLQETMVFTIKYRSFL